MRAKGGDPSRHASRALAWPLAAAAIGLSIVVFWPTWRAMAEVWWTSETFGHGMLVPPVAAWLAWRRQSLLGSMAARPSALGALVVGACAFAWLVGDLAGVNVVAQFAVVGVVVGLVLAVGGVAFSKAVAFPLAFLFFMVPAGESLNPPLMEATADATVWAVRASGVPVFREGLQFALPTGRWSVVEACSGLRYVIAAAVLGALFAYLNFAGTARRLAFFVACIAIALVANWARAYVIVMVGHFSGMTLGVGEDHVVYGWVFFGIVMFGVFLLGARWRDPVSPDESAAAAAAARPAAYGSVGASQSMVSRVVLAVAAVTVLCVGARVASARLADVMPRDDTASLAARLLGDPLPEQTVLPPAYAGERAAVRGRIETARRLEYFAAYYARQEPGREMIAFGNGLLADHDPVWSPASVVVRDVEVGGVRWPVREWRLRSAGGERLAWEWFTVAGRVAATERHAKSLAAWGMLSGEGDHSTVSVVSVDLEPLPAASSEAETERVLTRAREAMAEPAARLARFSREQTTRP